MYTFLLLRSQNLLLASLFNRSCLCSSVSATLLSRWMEAVKKGKVYENERQIIHTSTHTHTYPSAPPLLFPRSVSGGHLFRKAKKGLSVYFTLEIKLGFKWWPLTRGHICSVTNFTPPSSPGGSPDWPHPGNLWPPFAWTKRAEGRVFRLTEITCLHKRYKGWIFWLQRGISAIISYSSIIMTAQLLV